MAKRIGMDSPLALAYERTNGYESEAARAAKIGTKVVVAGLGGGGAFLATLLAAEGYGSISIIDGDRYSETDWRVPFVDTDTVGLLKTDVVAEKIHAKNPEVNLQVFDGRLSPDNAEDFIMAGTHKDQQVIVVDEIDLKGGGPAAALHLAQTARKLGYPVTSVTDIGKGGGTVTSYNPHSRYTYERINHIAAGTTYDTFNPNALDISNLAYLPTYGSIDTLVNVARNDVPVPTHPRGVVVASGLGLSEIERLALDGRGLRTPPPTWAPRMRWVDVDGTSGETRYPRLSHYCHLGRAALNDKVLRRNPAASYTLDDIRRRDAMRAMEK